MQGLGWGKECGEKVSFCCVEVADNRSFVVVLCTGLVLNEQNGGHFSPYLHSSKDMCRKVLKPFSYANEKLAIE